MASSHPLWPALRGQSELSGQPLTLGGPFAFAGSIEILRVLRPRFPLAAIWFTGTTKKSHAYVTVTYIEV